MKKLLSIIIAITLISSSYIIAFAQNNLDETVDLDEYGLGLIIDDNYTDNCIIDYNETNTKLNNNINNRDLPSSIDLSTEEAFPCIRSQGWVGSCTSWAAVYYQFGYQVAKNEGWNAKTNPTKQFSPRYIHNIVNGGENNGTGFNVVYSALKNRGAVKYYQFAPNPSNNGILEYRKWLTDINFQKEALRYRISNEPYERAIISSQSNDYNTPITNTNSPCLATIKSYLNTGHVLTFGTHYGVQVDRSNYNIVTGYSSGNTNINWIYKSLPSGNHSGEKVCVAGADETAIDYPDDDDPHDHSLSIVGYDDNIWFDYNEDGIQQDPEMGAFKIANSHGTDYGNNGFMWVMYDALNIESNFSSYNSNRLPIMVGYKYNVIELEYSDKELLAEVTLSQSKRWQHSIRLSLNNSSNAVTSYYPMGHQGGIYRYDGTESIDYQSATFVFDYNYLVSGNRGWKHYGISISDLFLDPTTYISNIKLVDKTGKAVVYDTYNDYISNQLKTFDYYIALVGDVNNDSYINVFDTIMIQNHLSGATTLTNNQILAADVNGDGVITNIDANLISQYSAEIITQFPNGAFVQLVS